MRTIFHSCLLKGQSSTAVYCEDNLPQLFIVRISSNSVHDWNDLPQLFAEWTIVESCTWLRRSSTAVNSEDDLSPLYGVYNVNGGDDFP